MLDTKLEQTIKNNWDNLLKPLDSLGDFETMLARMGAVLKDEAVGFEPACLLVYVADNGIIAEGVAQSDESVTLSVTEAMGRDESSVCHMTEAAGVDMLVANIGLKNAVEIDGVDCSHYVAAATKNFAHEPAMSEEEYEKALDAGRYYANLAHSHGYKTLILGEMGIGNTTTSTAVIAAVLGCRVKDICGRGAGLSDAGLERKCQVIEDALTKYNLMEADVKSVLMRVGGFDIVAMAGTILEAERLGMPVVLDGLITAAAALAAVRLSRTASDVIFFSHKGREKGITMVADALGMKPLIEANLALGEGSGGVMLIPLLRTALAVYAGGTTFSDAGIKAYRRQL